MTENERPESPPSPSSAPGAWRLFWPGHCMTPVSQLPKSSRATRASRSGALARSPRRWARRAVTAHSAALDATLLWLCVPDREIRRAASVWSVHLVARALLPESQSPNLLALHSSGALSSRELDPLRKAGVAVASAHPLMTFVAGAHPFLTGVPFAMEGDEEAARVARQIVRELGGESFSLPATRKAAYHAWATMTSPLLLAFLVTLEEAARAAGLHAAGCAPQEPAHHPADSGQLLAPRSGALVQRPAGSWRRGDGGETLGGAEEASRSARGLCGAGASRYARPAGEESG